MLQKIIAIFVGIFFTALSTVGFSYTVDCNDGGAGDPSIQEAIDLIGNTETIFIDGVCSDQGSITISTSGVRLQGAGGSSGAADHVIEGTLDVRGAQIVELRFLTVDTDTNFAITMNEMSNLRVVFANVNTNTTSGRAIAFNVLSGRLVLIGSNVSATASSGDAAAVLGSSNATVVSVLGNSISANASNEAVGIRVSNSSAAFVDEGDIVIASGATSTALEAKDASVLGTLDIETANVSTAVDGDILVTNNSTARLDNIDQVSGDTIVLDSSFEIDATNLYSTSNPIAVRNGSLSILDSSVSVDVDAFLNSVVTLDEGSDVDGTVSLQFGSRAAILSSSSLDTAVVEKGNADDHLFVDVTSSVANIEKQKKPKKNKKD